MVRTLLSKKTYHFLIPRENFWNNRLDTNIKFEDALLYGIIHCNGFGHLVSINGIEGGSEFLSGRKIMNFFDSLCYNLSVRSIDVLDLSTKWFTPSRLVYGIAFGNSWFGSWGYKFSHGCFGLLKDEFEKALNDLSAMEVDDLFLNRQTFCDVSGIISYSRILSSSSITTLRDLFKLIIVSMTKDETLSHVPSAFVKERKLKKNLQGSLCLLYENLLMGQLDDSIQLLLKNNRFVKEWVVEDLDMNLCYLGYVLPTSNGLSLRSSPGDLIVVPFTSSYNDLKTAAQEAFRSNYCMLDAYDVESVENDAAFDLEPDEWIACLMNGSKLFLKGSMIDFDTQLKYQGGPTLSNVGCPCGTRSHDGEKMATCFRCKLTQHLKCNNVANESAIPPLFLCQACCLTAN